MNREFKFRGQRLHTKEWVVGYYNKALTSAKYGDISTIHRIQVTGIENYFVVPETIGQFTGFKDLKNRDIFHGDIVTTSNYPFIDEGKQNYVGIVDWIFGGWQIVLKCVNPNKSGISNGVNDWLDQYGTISTSYEILGNIHENPELLDPR